MINNVLIIIISPMPEQAIYIYVYSYGCIVVQHKVKRKDIVPV